MPLVALMLGIYGYLFPGFINVTLAQLSANRQHKPLMQLLSVVLVFEFMYSFLSLYFVQQLANQASLLQPLKWLSTIMLFALSIYTFITSKKSKSNTHPISVSKAYAAAIIHPQHIIFWSVWGVILMQQKFISTQLHVLLLFCLLNAVGCLFTFTLYIKLGKKLQAFFNGNHRLIAICLATIYLVLSLYELLQLVS